MNINTHKGIKVEVSLLPRKNRTVNTIYDIYVAFSIYQNGIRQFQPYCISTAKKVKIDDWQNGMVKGKSTEASALNKSFRQYMNDADGLLTRIAGMSLDSCSEVLEQITINAKEVITGKAPRGKKADIINRLEEYSYENMMRRKLAERKLAKGRIRGYECTYELLKEYFKDTIPTMNKIDGTKLLEFKKTLTDNPNLTHNTVVDYCSKIIAVFNYAVDKNVIAKSPIPKNFRGSFVDGERVVLTDNECVAIANLDDASLTPSEQEMKYSILVQLTTGMGYSEMKEVRHEHIKFDDNLQSDFIGKNREKTMVKFRTFFSYDAKFYVEKLKALVSNEERPFNLPSIEYATRIYKIIGLKAGVKNKVTTYNLRHTFAVNFMDSDGKLEDLKEILGHEDIKTTAIYGKISNKRLAGAMKAVAAKSVIHQIQTKQMKAV